MRRPTLAVDTTQTNNHHRSEYELTQSPSTFIGSAADLKMEQSSEEGSLHDEALADKEAVHSPIPPPADEPRPAPSIRLLFSLLQRQHLLLLVLPAAVLSIISGGIAPFMTWVIGESFDAFAKFPLSNPTKGDKDALLHSVGLAALELVALAAGSLALSSITSSLWIWTGERNVMALRRRVYTAVTEKDMIWFDTRMGSEGAIPSEDGPIGAGGLMAKFARETDDVRMASSLASGQILQHLTTSIACLLLAFLRSWSLTLVILSAVPALIIVQGISQRVAGPLVAVERDQTAAAATLVDRATAAIATVKAFNAQPTEARTVGVSLDRVSRAAKKLNAVWGVTGAASQFVMMSMFVQGFWFGAKLVRDGSASAGAVMAVFWACLIATSNLQMCIPQMIVLAKGKFAAAELIGLATTSTAPSARRLRGICPRRCDGELALVDVTFAYPARPRDPVLRDVSLFLPARETTFIVGGSGSGKSTVAALLLRLYAPHAGALMLDDNDVRFLDEGWVREHVAGVAQGCILFDMSVHDNVAMGVAGPGSGRKPEDVTRKEVEEACRLALMHEFVRDLPEGYDTKLGNGGANLSGGQKQRLAIARARLRNPSVLVLDEATSALDATSRILVFEAIKHWRRNQTTVVITHDLSQIGPQDFVYVLKDGHVSEQGYRADLEAGSGEFRAMAEQQGATGGFVPDDAESVRDRLSAILEAADLEKDAELEREAELPLKLHHQSLIARPTTTAWMFDAVQEIVRPADAPNRNAQVDRRHSVFVPTDAFTAELQYERQRRPSSISIDSFPPPPPEAHTYPKRRLSLQFTPTSPVYSFNAPSQRSSAAHLVEDDESFEAEKSALKRSGTEAGRSRVRLHDGEIVLRRRWDDAKMAPMVNVKVEQSGVDASKAPAMEDKQIGFWKLVREIWPTIPYKPLLFFGIFVSLASGAMTPIFSFLLSRLLFEVSIGAKNVSLINIYGAIVLAVAATDGILMGLKYFVMETAGMSWVTRIRKTCFARVLAQDKRWFDKSENSPVALTQVLVKDGDDARQLIATVLAQFAVVAAMLSIGLIWALVQGWQLTLVGFAIAPVFAGTMAVQTSLAAKCEFRNKRAREEVAKGYYEAITNIRGIRAMAFESIFRQHFDEANDRALSTGVRGAFVEGCTYGVASALIYLAEAVLFYVGAVLIAKGTYTYLQMVEVLNLVVFTVTIGSQLMAFTQKIAKSVQATRDFNRLLSLSSTATGESRGSLLPPIQGTVAFDDVTFSYPERPDTQVLKNITLEIAEGECVAVVGSSGSGKSTVAALLQRLYEPDSGSIFIGPHRLQSTDVKHLRDHVAVVSQNPNLFDATISANIAYGGKPLSEQEIRRAAKAANVHDFIMSLPQGYDTLVGENASLISGGQAQRLQIARALARPSNILILDECTSALDPANQAAVIDTIRTAKVGRTTVMVTHKLQVMRMCDRILVLQDGELAEQGTYEQLMGRNGVFAALANGGEWQGE